MSANRQRILWPWETRKWPEIKQKICMDKIHSIVDMDSRIASMHVGKLRPRQITELFNSYYTDEQYLPRIEQSKFIEKILPMMQKMIGDAPKIFKNFNSRLLVPTQTTNIVFSRTQIAVIMASIWFGLFDYNYVTKGKYRIEDFPEPTFINIFLNQNIFALQCIINYFDRVYEYLNSDLHDEFNGGNIIVKRFVLTNEPNWADLDVPISEIFLGEGTQDDSPAKMHTAFAHEFIGGDMFKGPLTQEEIILLIRPECMIATLFCARLDSNEVVVVLGAEKMSQYMGYGSSVRFRGNFIDAATKGYNDDETEVMLQCAVVFMDASPKSSGVSQFINDFQRDLNKAYCGFSSLAFSKPGEYVAGGNWTYGFNGNNMQIKFIQQALAASLAGKSLIYYPFGREFENKIVPFIDWIAKNKFTISGLYNEYINLMSRCYTGPKSRLGNLDVIDCLMDQ
jgi:poly(ADP-ribose) glycohydrolase